MESYWTYLIKITLYLEGERRKEEDMLKVEHIANLYCIEIKRLDTEIDREERSY